MVILILAVMIMTIVLLLITIIIHTLLSMMILLLGIEPSVCLVNKLVIHYSVWKLLLSISVHNVSIVVVLVELL